VLAAFEALGWTYGLHVESQLKKVLWDCAWRTRTAQDPRLPSGLSHGWPWGLSLAFGQGEPQLRLLVEPQAAVDSAQAYAAVAMRLVGAGQITPPRELALLAQVDRDAAPFRGWLSYPWHARGSAETKVYLCPTSVTGLSAAGFIDEVAPGFADRHAEVRDGMRPQDRLTVVAAPVWRFGDKVQLYVHQPRPPLARLDRWSASTVSGAWGDATALAEALLPPGAEADWLTSLRFVRGERRPVSAAHHLPVRHLGLDDAWISGRLADLCTELGGDPRPYEALRQHPRLLGLRHHFVSIQRREGQLRLAAYFVPSVGR
jgi:hypothetical protein